MLVRTMQQLESEGRVISISHGKATAVRPLTKSDGVGFSMSEARGGKVGHSDLWYKNHWEANLVLAGSLDVIDKNSGEKFTLGQGDVYCVGPDDPHQLVAQTDVELLCIFNPPLTGKEVHDSDGAYPASGPLPPGPGLS